MTRPISDLAKNDSIAFSEIDFSGGIPGSNEETELHSVEEPHYGYFFYQEDDNTVHAYFDFSTNLAEGCKEVIEDELADDEVDLENIDWDDVVFSLAEELKDLVDNATRMNLHSSDNDACTAAFTLAEVFGMDESLSSKREDFNKINEIIRLQSDESRRLAIDTFHELNPDIELI